MEENKKSTPENKQSKNERIEQFLQEHYESRFNTVKSRTEIRKANSKKSYTPMTKFDVNSIRRALDKIQGITTSSENIRAILESNFCIKVNPVQEYFLGLPIWNENNPSTIMKLANCVVVANSEKWENYFKKWLVAVVANAMDDYKCCNHTCLVLTGQQGKFKTTFLDLLCPKSLSNYLYTGKIYPQSKDTQTLIAEYLYINIDDQLKALNKQDENELKNLITTPRVKYRRPYDVYIEEYPHLASFMASINGNDFLTDPTGSRRFLPFEVENIDIETAKTIKIDNVYSEAFTLLKQGFKYWFSEEEIKELNKRNEQFQVQTTEYEMLIKGFETPTNDTEDCYMTTSDILIHLRFFTSVRLQEKRMGEALKKAGFKRVSKRINGKPMYVYHIQKVEPNPFIR